MSDLDDAPVSPPASAGATGGRSRSVLGALLVLLIVAVLLALWFLLTDGDDDTAVSIETDQQSAADGPTPLPIPTSTAVPSVVDAQDLATPEPTPVPTPMPEGFEACGDARAPLLTSTYIVDTLSTPLNQRSEPSVDGDLLGAFDPGQSGLVFNGECVVNLADGYVWWQIDNGSQDVWIAASFVTPK